MEEPTTDDLQILRQCIAEHEEREAFLRRELRDAVELIEALKAQLAEVHAYDSVPFMDRWEAK